MILLSRIWTWRKDQVFRRILGNAGLLTGGTLGASLLSFVAFSLTARALGPASFGILSLIQAYVMTVDLLINFQSWQAVIKYGAEAQQSKRPDDLRALIKFAMLIDGATAFLGCILAAAGVFWYGTWQGWDADVTTMAVLYCGVILFRLEGTPTAVMRLHNQFKSVAIVRLAVPFFRIIGVVPAFLLSNQLWVYVLVWMAADIIGNLVLQTIAWIRMAKENCGLVQILKSALRGISTAHPGLIRFVFVTNISTSVRLGVKEADLFLVGWFLGPAATGLYKVAREFARIPAALLGPWQESLYPELARLWAGGLVRDFVAALLRTAVMTGMVGTLIWAVTSMIGDHLLAWTVGSSYVSGKAVLVLYMLSIVVFTFGIPLLPSVLSVGRPGLVLWVYLGASALFFAVLPPLSVNWGVMGAALAQVIFQLAWFLGMTLCLVQPLREGFRRGTYSNQSHIEKIQAAPGRI